MKKRIRRIDLKVDDERYLKLRNLKENLEKSQGRKILWPNFIYNSVTEFFKLQKKEKKK